MKISSNWIVNNFFSSSNYGLEIYELIKKSLKDSDNEFMEDYEKWELRFNIIYPADEIRENLYIKHCLLIYTITSILFLKINKMAKGNTPKSNEIQQSDTFLKKIFNFLKLSDYFQSFLMMQKVKEIQIKLISELSSFEIENEDLFTDLYQKLLENTTRHPKGEFYTHPILAQTMISDVYKTGMKVLDPTCGSGTFLLEIAKMVARSNLSPKDEEKAIDNIIGCDINPIACIMARANLFLSYDGFWLKNREIKIFETNLLTDNDFQLISKNQFFDLILGNPPWLVLNRIPSQSEKERIKKLGKELGILRGGKYQTSTELTTIFIYKMIRDFLKPDGFIFFVTPASLATGAQHSLFRQFCGLKNIEIWAFDEDVFRIHNLCFKASKGISDFSERNKIRWKLYHCSKNPIKIGLKSVCTYVPSKILGNHEVHLDEPNLIPQQNLHIGRLIPKSQLSKQTNNTSDYKKLFRQGASLVPRNLLFIDIIKKRTNLDLITIQPSTTLQSKVYSTWKFIAYKQAQVEPSNIFSVAKSTGLIPFYYLLPYQAFLPLEKGENDEFILQTPRSPFSLKHYQNLQEIYLKNKKKGAKIENLEKRLNYGKALTDPRQNKTPKVIYGGIGSIVKGAILTDSMIVDTSLYFYIPKNIEEAYYIIGYLNSPYTTEHVKLMGSTGARGSLRNIHKHPFNIEFPIFDKENNLHQKIARHSREIESYVIDFFYNFKGSLKDSEIKPKSIQNRLFKDSKYKKKLVLLNSFIEKLMG
ncbi:class I SAM-dependent DNA methyltransferase [Promethearchaeum syntrophicum]|uniref:Class I SAM-dependent DNA methyltransferase n=1 Tax=Promethearchaeum syntrophicum TaxID=2594042 RepID=A0A5B9DAV6_9ARCH